MFKLAQQGVRVVGKDQTFNITTSLKGNQFQRINVVPYYTNSDKGNATMWSTLLLFGDNCLPDITHNDFLLVDDAKLESSFYIPKSVQERMDSDPDFKNALESIGYKGKVTYTIICNSVKQSSKEEIREVMGFGDNQDSGTSTANNTPVADLNNLDDEDEIPF